jgi:putative endonuclease
MSFFVYILASRRNGTLYIGMTDHLARRIWQHRVEVVPGFTKKYSVKTLVWCEHTKRASLLSRESASLKNGIELGNCNLSKQ